MFSKFENICFNLQFEDKLQIILWMSFEAPESMQ